MKFTRKKVLITGGSRGIGKAAALAFAAEGAEVAVNFKSHKQAAQTVMAELPGTGHLALGADLSDPIAAEELIDTLLREWGRIDILVNNAGVYLAHPIAEVDYASWRKAWQDTLALNLFAAANLSYLFARQAMQHGGGGAIINVSSRGAFRGEPDHPGYAASKAALNALTQSLAQSLAPHQIQCMAVAPGFVATDMTKSILESPDGEAIRAQSPFGRVATAEEVAHAILFLADPNSRFSSGTILDVNGASYLRT